MEARGWDELDFLCVAGDAYVDHPSFGHAIVTRLIESLGYRVGVVAQPDWRSAENFGRMGKPRLGALVSAGNLDSMLSNYSAPGRRRRQDAYSPGGASGRRPDRAVIVYCNRIRELWGDVPLIIGGIEASLRRIAHYDYWSDAVRRSILVDSRADLLIYGMAETQIERITRQLSSGVPVREINDIPGTCWRTHDISAKYKCNGIELPSFDAVRCDKKLFADAFRVFYNEQNFASGRALFQDQGAWIVAQNPPPPPMSTAELDKIYSLPYARNPHPIYGGQSVPAFAEVQFSITSHRGCFGECSFCAISLHQGRVIQCRSRENILNEAEAMTRLPDFKGYISDVGGPTANFRARSCAKSFTDGACRGRSCLYPDICRSLKPSHSEYMELLRSVASLDGVKKVFVRSGLRYDYIMAAPDGMEFLEELCMNHVSGQLKIAPEHVSEPVLKCMRKSGVRATEKFIRAYREINLKLGKKQFLTPYFMSSHPGSGLEESLELAEFMRAAGVRPEQAQEFTPTPGTLAACMYHTGLDPLTGKPVYVARDPSEKAMQRAMLQYWMPCNRKLVERALYKLNRTDLVGTAKKCLIK
jgi:uncharacterized radical SAM protein YgiQ